MVFQNPDIIYVHIPRTGGNWFQSSFLKYSTDEKFIKAKHDGIHRFGVHGRYTREKHQPLRVYRSLLGSDFFRYAVWTTVRFPVSRLLSVYFSPRRHLAPSGDGHWSVKVPQKFCPKRFARIVEKTPSCCEYLGLIPAMSISHFRCRDYPRYRRLCEHSVAQSNLQILKYEDILGDVDKFLEKTGFELDPEARGNIVNASANPGLKLQLEKSPEVVDVVMRSHHRVDAELLYP